MASDALALQFLRRSFVLFVNANFADSEDRHFLGQLLKIFSKLRVRMRVGRSRKWNSFFHCQLDDAIAGVKFLDRFAPAGRGKFNSQIARANELERLLDHRPDVTSWAMPVNLD